MTKTSKHLIVFISVAVIGFLLNLSFSNKSDYASCKLCDGNQYIKVYDYFENGRISQVKFPFYNRPLVPFLASVIPGSNPFIGFTIINFIFLILGVWVIKELWDKLELETTEQYIGMFWLLFHWVGIIRLNQFDYITVDVPLYFFQALAVLIYLKGKYKWFYIIAPIALLQKESFLAIQLVLIGIHAIFSFNKKTLATLILSLTAGVVFQKLVLGFMPEQTDQRSSLMAILYHGNWALEDPTRFIRWFAAFGGAFGVLPLVVAFKFKLEQLKDESTSLLIVLSTMYMSFGLLAGEDMTRIIFLGFPFIMTLSLLAMKNTSIVLRVFALSLSIVYFRLTTFTINPRWAVDYTDLNHVYFWASYFATTLIVFALFILLEKKLKKL